MASGRGVRPSTAWLEVRKSVNGIDWGTPTRITLAHDGLYPWHVEVQWIASRGEFWALYNAKQPGSCTTPALFFATSRNGVSWTPVRRPVVAKGVHPAFQDIVYRSTFAYDPVEDDLRLWISGARFDRSKWIWSTLLIRKHRPSLFDKVARAMPPGLRATARGARRLAVAFRLAVPSLVVLAAVGCSHNAKHDSSGAGGHLAAG